MINDFQVSKEQLENRQLRLTITIPNDVLEPELRKAAMKAAKDITVPGFRKGRAPYQLLLARYGRESFVEEWYEKEGDDFLARALEEAEVKPFRPLEPEEVNWYPFKMTIIVPLEPTVELPDYSEVHVDLEEPQVTDEMIEADVKQLQEKYATWQEVDRQVQDGDRVTFDLTIAVNGEPEVEQPGMLVEIGEDSSSYVPRLQENLKGMTTGESKTYTIEANDNTNMPWEGEVVVEVTATKIEAKQPAPLTDDLIARAVKDKEIDEAISTPEELQAFLRRQEELAASKQANDKLIDSIIKTLTEKSHVDYPSILVEEELDNQIEKMKEALEKAGLSWEQYLEFSKQDETSYRKAARAAAEEQVARALVVNEFIKRENLDVSEDEVNAYIEEEILQGMDPVLRETSRKLYSSEKQQEEIRHNLLFKKLVEALAHRFSTEETEGKKETDSEEKTPDEDSVAEEAETETTESIPVEASSGDKEEE